MDKSLFTISFDGEIGYFPTYATAELAEAVAIKYRSLYPDHTYEVKPEELSQAVYAVRTNSVEKE